MSSSSLTFSIITVVFNDLKGLQQTEASLRSQVGSSFEWIVVDGASTDGTPAYLETIDLPLFTWSSGRDRGIYDAMNKGTARASGRYLIYLNAGDVFTDCFCVTDLARELEDTAWPELCYAGANWRFADGHLKYRAPRAFAEAIRHGLPGIHQSTAYRRDFLGSAPYDLSYSVSGDYYISADCYLRGARACYLERPIVDFMVGGTSLQKANQSLKEAWRIQRDVLRLGWMTRAISAVRRFAAHRGMKALHLFVFTQSNKLNSNGCST